MARGRLTVLGTLVLALVLSGAAGPAGCVEPKRLGFVLVPVWEAVAGYECSLYVTGVSVAGNLEWDFGDQTSAVIGEDPSSELYVARHVWANSGEYRVRVVAQGSGYWENRVRVRAAGSPVDLLAGLGPAEGGPGVAVSQILVYQRTRYTRVSDVDRVRAIVSCLRDAQTVTPRGLGVSSVDTELHFLDDQGGFLGAIVERDGVFRLLDEAAGHPGAYVLRANPVPALLISGPWTTGWVREGRLVPPPRPTEEQPLPSSCLGIEPGAAVPGNPIDALGLGAVWSIGAQEYWFTSARHQDQVAYVISLLRTAQKAPEDRVPDDPGWADDPRVLITVEQDKTYASVQFGFHPDLGLLSASASPGGVKEAYVISPELSEFLRRLGGS